MSEKYSLTGTLTFETQADAAGKQRTVTLPQQYTIEFSINRQSLSTAQQGLFTIKGLPEQVRDLIFKDQFNTADFEKPRAIKFVVGYGDQQRTVFNGQMFWAYSEKPEGDAQVTTIINAWDGGNQQVNGFTTGYGVTGNGQPGQPVPAGTTASDVIKNLAATIPGIKGSPIVGSFPQTNIRREALFGNTWDLIQQKSGGQAVISNQQVLALNLNECIAALTVPLVSSDTGLLGAPRRSGALVEWDSLLLPELGLFQLVQVQSRINRQFNGFFKVMGMRHHGVVSPVDVGDNRTTFSVLYGTGPLKNVFGPLVQ